MHVLAGLLSTQRTIRHVLHVMPLVERVLVPARSVCLVLQDQTSLLQMENASAPVLPAHFHHPELVSLAIQTASHVPARHSLSVSLVLPLVRFYPTGDVSQPVQRPNSSTPLPGAVRPAIAPARAAVETDPANVYLVPLRQTCYVQELV